ncbi:hypothetical protein [Deinococcus gobiensis]|uniref:Uncharacterized protein n=1 Tax=Deinococcus gobiensis (strain DSM 21396 / JCM 16679 / CGMCC 1.7299 / I-0) TaxID=745776 RepID=H8GX81_DEIGI|nr:hypothetical protein [Deinococcus gobiensis]AFD25810.1 hypothetical protein DGo_CA1883 [Deinococcus gobiensis I-0]
MTHSPLTLLGRLWPFFLLGRMDPPEEGTPTLDLMCPATPADLYAAYAPVFADTNPTAALGLELTVQDPKGERELDLWCKVLRAPLLKGQPDELLLMPSWLFLPSGQVLTGLSRLLTLDLFERQDVFLSAMHQRGLS